MRERERSHSSISLQAFPRFRTWTAARPGVLRFGTPIVLFAVLLMPSVWMLSVIPPLWRDVDAYGEVTQPFGPGTILLYGPLYCFAARIPLYLGYAIHSLSAGGPFPALHFVGRPILTDSGVFALLISQHVALCCSTYCLIISASRVFWVRLMLAIAWALNPLFYTFAHTVGSEALSMVLVLLLGATGLRIVQGSREVRRKDWLVFGILLWLCILTRHINAVLAALMPAAFFLLGSSHLIVLLFTRTQAFWGRRWLNVKLAFKQATIAVIVAIGCVVLANASVRVLCYAARIPYYSTLGLSFLFRLKFLATLPPEKRNELLDEVAKHSSSTDVRNIISLLRVSFPAGISNWDVRDFNDKARALLFPPPMDPNGDKYPLLLNHVAVAFLYPPNEIFLNAVTADFKRSQEITIPDVVSFLFVTTRFYFSHRGAMPQCASLVTFRGKDAAEVFAIFKKHSYFRHPNNLSYGALLFFWLINLALFLGIAKIRKQEAADLTSYAAALMAVGLLMMLANCFLAVFQPRYTLPMWELTIVSMFILFGGTTESLFSSSRRLCGGDT
jgi:hypothetical protein